MSNELQLPSILNDGGRPPQNRPENGRQVSSSDRQVDDEYFPSPTQQQIEDHRWLDSQPEFEVLYSGQYVVPYHRQIIGHGQTSEEAHEMARKYLAAHGLPAEPTMAIHMFDLNYFDE